MVTSSRLAEVFTNYLLFPEVTGGDIFALRGLKLWETILAICISYSSIFRTKHDYRSKSHYN